MTTALHAFRRTALAAVLVAGACVPAQNGSPDGGSSSVVSADSRVTMERLPCYGTCPVYVVSIDADGVEVFEADGKTLPIMISAAVGRGGETMISAPKKSAMVIWSPVR